MSKNPITNMKGMKNFSWSTVGAVVVGMAVFGSVAYGVSRLPRNDITRPIQETVEKVTENV